MHNAFDPIAKTYDSDFTNSEIGKLQRKIVWKYLEKQNTTGKNILEINCGTGEDAIFLTKKGYTVHATDISSEMLRIAKEKFVKENLKIETFQWNLNDSFPFSGKKYDLIFSNFGGLNCLSPEALKKLSAECYQILNPEGKLIFVVMGRFCLWETMYFLMKGKIQSAFRRRSKKAVKAMLDKNTFVNTWYYSAKDLQHIFAAHFKYLYKKPVGIFIPPSYLNTFFKEKKPLTNFFFRLEKIFTNISALSFFADHYLIELEKM
jgi:ubiquinone/menaquinone biosynthesis C-methylase UbiE